MLTHARQSSLGLHLAWGPVKRTLGRPICNGSLKPLTTLCKTNPRLPSFPTTQPLRRSAPTSPLSTAAALLEDFDTDLSEPTYAEWVKDREPLGEEQAKLLDLLMSGKNVFFTGRAGTGKTEVLRHFIKKARESGKKVAITSATGIAASHIDGQTIHSFMSYMGHHTSTKYALHAHVEKFANRRRPYLKTDILVIDEASMIDPRMFDQLDYVARKLRKGRSKLPFGGMQMVICGDFYQLPPVMDRKLKKRNVDKPAGGWQKEDDHYLFESEAWEILRKHGEMQMVELRQIYRQIDPQFIEVLDRVRRGVYDDFVTNALRSCRYRKWSDEHISPPTLITAYNESAAQHNYNQLLQLPGDVTEYMAADSFELDNSRTKLQYKDSFLGAFQRANPEGFMIDVEFDNFIVPYIMPLKIGAQVVLARNLSVATGLVNGIRGRVVGFAPLEESPETLKIPMRLPLVQFTNQSEPLKIGYQKFELNLGPERGNLIRRQIPLKLAWALTVHKSQGMTLDRVVIDLKTAFASGMAYTALSRVTGLEGLKVAKFKQESVFVSPKVLEFSKGLGFV